MIDRLALFAPALVGAALSICLWVFVARALAARGASRWRAVPFGLPLLLIPLGYGLFWLGFFSSPSAAVQLHAIRLTASHFAGPFVPWIIAAWFLVAIWIIRPLLRP